MVYQDPKLLLFALNSNLPLAEKISEATGVPLGHVSSRQFSDGEIQVNIEESVRGHDIYIIQSTSFPVNDHLWELLIMIDACKRASANTVNVVMPYFGYARADRTAKPHEPITAKLVANMLVKAGIDRILTLDLHTVQVQGFFDVPADNLFTVPIFADYYREKGLLGDEVVVVAPKNSGIKRARSLAEYLEAPIAIVDYQEEKERDANSGYLIGDVAGKKAILIDDILTEGITFGNAAIVLSRYGVGDIFACASHGLFLPGSKERLEAAHIKEILVTDSVKSDNDKPESVKFLTTAPLIADAIVRIHEGRPVSPLFNYDKAQG
ncbi:MAG: ribose-phosphate diphosphokinase [Streptococcaceae bacterium]|jgi:ribose-phosphate pyrophosphokinase|nr:ribose-phosphate diphosphokinase [Streptococcaceae bacterium]